MDLQKKLMSINLDYYMILFLSIMAFYNVFVIGITETLPQLFIAVITASFVDILINYIKTKQVIKPYHAIISGIFIAIILPTGQKWYILAIIVIIAILSKHLIKVNNKNLFNPAMFGLFFATLLFKQPLQWWGAAPLPLVLLFGLLISYRFKRFHLTLTYIITSILLFFIFSLLNNNPLIDALILSIFSINFYFVFFMLVEPITSPIYKKGRIAYGFSVAVLSFIFGIYVTQFGPNNISLLIVNLFVPLINKYIRS